MKLPDFTKFDPLNRLKHLMGIPDGDYGQFSLQIDPGRLTAEELDKLTSGEGIDVKLEDVTVLDDGTLAYKNSRVLLYIRDVHVHGDRESEPRYHLMNCTTLHEMKASGRFYRYVVAAETTGVFKINLRSTGKARTERRRLSVCQNCLHGLSFDGFSLQMRRDNRARVVSEFTPDRFFAVYPRSLHHEQPPYNSDTAPLDDYTSDFSDVSNRLRERAGWTCSQCGRNLAQRDHRRFLHVHHMNGKRSDNSERNLRVLCIGCHAEQPHHAHLKGHPDYRAFFRICTP